MKKTKVFISHNKNDKPQAREIATFLVSDGVDTFLDEWEIQAGDSIVGKVNHALADTTHFVLIWSDNANASKWVTKELESAISAAIEDSTMKIIPVCLPDFPKLPSLIRDISRLNYDPNMNIVDRGNYLVDSILGRKGQADVLKTVAQLRTKMLKVEDRENYNPDDIRNWGYNACPECGGSNFESDASSSSYGEDSMFEFSGIGCLDCGWSETDATAG